MRYSRRLIAGGLASLVTVATVIQAQERSWDHQLPGVLDALAELVERYRDEALRFTCDESVYFHTHTGRIDEHYRYFYVNRGEDGLLDYRVPRKRKNKVVAPDALKRRGALIRAYSWVFIFEKGRAPHYTHEIDGVDDEFGSPAFRIRSTPIAPYYRDVNEWHLTTWIDVDTHQLLRVEAYGIQDHRNKQIHEQLLEEIDPDPRVIQYGHVVTEFGTMGRELRLPSQVTTTVSRFQIPGDFSRFGYRVALTRQVYRNYRFYDVGSETFAGALPAEALDAYRQAIEPAGEPAQPEPPPDDDPVASMVDGLEPRFVKPTIAEEPPQLQLVKLATPTGPALPLETEPAQQPEIVAAPTPERPPVRIVSPNAGQILYGPTRVVVESDDGRVSRVALHLDDYPEPICEVPAGSPMECPFDAGTAMQSRNMTARAFDAAGTPLGEAVVQTLGFPKPEIVTRRSLMVPVVASYRREDPPRLSVEQFSCRFAGQPCKVISARKLSESARFPVSLEILVDTSRSVRFNRDEMLQALHYVIDEAPLGVEIAVTEFNSVYSRLSPFTSDKDELREAVLNISGGQSYTCLMQAVRRSLTTLHQRAGHKLLLLITDGMETCQLTNFMGRGPTGQSQTVPYDVDRANRRVSLLVDPNSLADTVLLARSVGVPIYAFRVNQELRTRNGWHIKWSGSWEGLALETGGRIFNHGDIYGLPAALRDLVEDLEGTWLVDVDIPRTSNPNRQRLLELDTPDDDRIRLRYPEFWQPTGRLPYLTALLRSGEASHRGWAASELRNTRDRALAAPLLRAWRRESDPANRQVEQETLLLLVASLLLHGDREDQQVALDAAEELIRTDPTLGERLDPALEVYRKTDPEPRLARKAERWAIR